MKRNQLVQAPNTDKTHYPQHHRNVNHPCRHREKKSMKALTVTVTVGDEDLLDTTSPVGTIVSSSWQSAPTFPYLTPRMEHLRKVMTFWVSVPV